MIIKLNLKNNDNFEFIVKEYPDILNEIIIDKYLYIQDSHIL